MKKQIFGTKNVPSFRSTQDVNTLQERYFSSMTDDCEVKTDSDRYYMAAIFSSCIGFVFPPCFLIAAYCVFLAKKGGSK